MAKPKSKAQPSLPGRSAGGDSRRARQTPAQEQTAEPAATEDASRPAEDAAGSPASRPNGPGNRLPPAASEFGRLAARHAHSAGLFVWRHARRLSLYGVRTTRPLEIGLRATGLVVAACAPLWPLFGAVPDGWWDWFLTTLANLGIGFALFGAGETVRKIDQVHREVVTWREATVGETSP